MAGVVTAGGVVADGDGHFSSDRLAIRTWPVTAQREFPARSGYVELVWGGVLGPTTLLAYRRLAALVDAGATEVNLFDLAAGLGVRYGGGRHSPMVRSLDRLILFKAASFAGDALAVRAGLPPVPEHRLNRLGPSAIRVHTRALQAYQPNLGPADPEAPVALNVATSEAKRSTRLRTDATIPPAHPAGPDRAAGQHLAVRFGRTG